MTEFISFEVDMRGLNFESQGISKSDKKKILEGMGTIMEKNVVMDARRQHLFKTGTFIGSISKTVKDDSVYVHDGVDYGVHLEFGTRPHRITPKNKKALFWDGAEHPVKSVMHPGTKAYMPFRKGLIASKKELEVFVGKSIENLSKRGKNEHGGGT